MKKFRDFIKERNDMTPALGDYGSNNETLMIISRMAMENHLEDLIRFFEKLSKKDSQIKIEFENYLKDKTAKKPLSMFPKKERDQVLIVRNDEPEEPGAL